MPYVPVPKDLTKVKTKVAAGLTKRQLICFSLGGLVGLPAYFLTRGAIGNSASVLLMIGLMMPFFFFAMYERDGQPAEKLLKNRQNSKRPRKNVCKGTSGRQKRPGPTQQKAEIKLPLTSRRKKAAFSPGLGRMPRRRPSRVFPTGKCIRMGSAG